MDVKNQIIVEQSHTNGREPLGEENANFQPNQSFRLATIEDLPYELLSRIFLDAIPVISPSISHPWTFGENYSDSPHRVRQTLCLVSKYWREIIRDSPRIQACVALFAPPFTRTYENIHSRPRELINGLIDRSHRFLMDIYLRIEFRGAGRSVTYAERCVLVALRDQLHRTRTLVLHLGLIKLINLHDLFKPDTRIEAPHLERFHCTLGTHSDISSFTPGQLHAPKLHSAVICRISSILLQRFSPETCSSIRNISLYRLTANEVGTLRQCHNIQNLIIKSFQPLESNLNFSTLTQAEIHLPNPGENDNNTQFFHFPGMTSLTLRGRTSPIPLEFFSKHKYYGTLRELRLVSVEIRHEFCQTLLKCLPTIESLGIESSSLSDSFFEILSRGKDFCPKLQSLVILQLRLPPSLASVQNFVSSRLGLDSGDMIIFWLSHPAPLYHQLLSEPGRANGRFVYRASIRL
ncbi:hypothetical protein M422DRAFT_254786 [Sphaerobolus stellatus SS14]|uniref:F-box domain-containing protein n=1 Tax=Sphaerobolus stellatus (strain SS14) TaxID=990650 RepID=A0A0C9VUY9_SPHS4|nr:hypothetical protein M422DRAFT_254786 [Sphaerobolus stellatus SS14]